MIDYGLDKEQEGDIEKFIIHVFGSTPGIMKTMGLSGVVERINRYMFPSLSLGRITSILLNLPAVEVSMEADDEMPEISFLKNFRVVNDWVDCEVLGPGSNDRASVEEVIEIAVRLAIAQYLLSFPPAVPTVTQLRC